MDNKDKIKYLNGKFDSFLKEVSNVRKNVELEEEFARGYLKCISDILESVLKSGDESSSDNNEPEVDISNVFLAIERISDMRSRRKVINELADGLSSLLSAYKSMQPADGSE